MILGIIFGVLIVCFIAGLFRDAATSLMSYVWELIITALAGALIGWIFGFWYYGAIVGLVYAVLCWLFRWENKILSWCVCRGE